MATEGPQLRDGGNTVAAANYYSPGSALSGPNGSGQYLAVKLSTSADRTATLANTGGEPIFGVLQNTPESGAPCDVCMGGITKAVGGAAITRGAQLMTDTSARLITATSGNQVVGFALESCGAANDLFTVYIIPGGWPHA
jgi:hypothetical protein